MTHKLQLEFSSAEWQFLTAEMNKRGWQHLQAFVQDGCNQFFFGQNTIRPPRNRPILDATEYDVVAVIAQKPCTTSDVSKLLGKWYSATLAAVKRLSEAGLIECLKETYTGGRPAKIWQTTQAGLEEFQAESERRRKAVEKAQQLAQLRMADSAAASRAQQAPKQKTVREQFAKIPDFVLPEAHTYYHTWVEKYFNKFPQATFDQALAAFFSRYTPIKGHIEWSAECNMNDMSWEYATEDLVKNGWEYDIEGKTLDPLPADAPGPVKEFDLDQELSMSALEKFAEGRK